MLLSAGISGRAFFGCSFFMVIALVSSVALFMKEIHIHFRVVVGYAAILSVLVFYNFSFGIIDIYQYWQKTTEREQFIQSRVSEGNMNLVVNYITPEPTSKYVGAKGLRDVQNNVTEYPSTSMSGYYGVSTITGVSNELFDA